MTTDLRIELIEAIINAYHTTRLGDTPYATHILSKEFVKKAFDNLETSFTEGQCDHDWSIDWDGYGSRNQTCKKCGAEHYKEY